MSDASSPNVITIDGRAIEYRLERQGDTTALILHGGHMSAQCRFGEETFLEKIGDPRVNVPRCVGC
jgi:hypothetical protein